MWGENADLHGDIAGASTSGRGLAGAKVITYRFQDRIPAAREGQGQGLWISSPEDRG